MTQTYDFPTFAVWWMMRQSMTTPPVHYRMMRWLERHGERKNARMLLQAFRGAGKSTLVGLYCAWRLYQDPNLRILVLAADTPLAKKMVRNVKRILERHPLTTHMRPKTADQWAGDQFTVNRAAEFRDPSMMARGITSNITGSRADLIICDDVEVPNTSDSPDKREDLRERLNEMAFILVPGGAQIYIGTPHTYHSIYAEKPRKDLGEKQPFLHGFKRYMLPIINKYYKPTWPERYTPQDIDRIRLENGPNKFKSQMLLEPVNIADGRLNPDLLKIYHYDLDYAKEIGTLFIGETKMVSASAWWDPAFASATGDYSVCAILFFDKNANAYIHHLEYIKLNLSPPSPPVNGGEYDNEADAQCRVVSQLLKDHYLPSLTVEANGIGKFLPNMLRGVLAKYNVPCAVVEAHNTRKKELRILEAFDAPLAAGKIHVHENVLKTPFMTEMREWRPERSKGYDDGLDAVAGALLQAPLKLQYAPRKGSHNWMRSPHKPVTADTDFNV